MPSYEPLASNARPISTDPIAAPPPIAIHATPYSVESERNPKYRDRRNGVTSSSPPMPKPIIAAATRAEVKDAALDNRKMPAAANTRSAADT